MDNLFFDNNIVVTITKSPENPIEGDDVVFTSSVSISDKTENYSNNSTYFFSYSWMESQDGGNTYYAVGQDLPTLTISNISKNFFNNLYKVQVALIDLDNIILTENGDNLTTQFEEILLGNDSSSGMSIQSSNNTKLSDAPSINGNTDVTALDIVNLEAIIEEAVIYDTTLDDTNKSIVSGGQITINQNNKNQIISGSTPQQITLETLPDTTIETPTEELSVLGGSLPSNCGSRTTANLSELGLSLDCGVIVYCRDIPPCNSLESVTLKVHESLGTFPNYVHKVMVPNEGGIFNNYKTEDAYTCCKVWTETCAYEKQEYDENCTLIPLKDKCINRPTFKEFREKYAFFPGDTAPPKPICGCEGATPVTGTVQISNAQANWSEWAGNLVFGGGFLGAYALVATGVIAGEFVILAGVFYGIVLTSHLVMRGVGGVSGIYNKNSGQPLMSADCYDHYGAKEWRCYDPVGSITQPYSRTWYIDIVRRIDLFYSTYEPRTRSDSAPTYSCSCKKPGYIFNQTGSIKIVEEKDCSYFITEKTGPAGSKCTCTRQSNPPEGSFSGFDKTLTFDIPSSAGKIPISIQERDFSDCVKIADGENCEARGRGVRFCGEGRIIYTVSSSKSTVVCNKDKEISLDDGAKAIWRACSSESGASIDVVIVKIKASLAGCEPSASGDNYDTYPEAKKKAETLIGNKLGFIANWGLVKETDSSKWKTFGTYTSENGTEQKLKTKAKSQYSGGEWINKDCTGLCIPVYELSISGDSYPCNDSTPLTKFCGSVGKCNSTATQSTSITLATIRKLESPTKEQVQQAKKDKSGPGLYLDVGQAISNAEAEIKKSGKPGIIKSSPCPS
jgi:hypothetical protein